MLKVGLVYKCIFDFPTHSDVDIFSVICCIGIFQMDSGFLLEKTDPYVGIYAVCLWKEE